MTYTLGESVRFVQRTGEKKISGCYMVLLNVGASGKANRSRRERITEKFSIPRRNTCVRVGGSLTNHPTIPGRLLGNTRALSLHALNQVSRRTVCAVCRQRACAAAPVSRAESAITHRRDVLSRES